MKTVTKQTILAGHFSNTLNCLYVYQCNYPHIEEISYYPTRLRDNIDSPYTVAVFKVKAKTVLPVMQVNKEGQLVY